MAFRFFSVPIHDSGTAAEELNGFLHSHKVLSIDRRWVEQGSASFWSFCVDYLERSADGIPASPWRGGARGKVDYREVLKPEDFAIFARLRELRKEIAQAEAVPVYTIFTNEQLAQMVQARSHQGRPGEGRRRRRRPHREVWPADAGSAGQGMDRRHMKRAGHLFDEILDRDNLRLAFIKALRGKRDRPDARASCRHLDQQLGAMAEQFAAGTFPLGRFHQFIIYDPKERIITAPCFRRARAASRDHERLRAGLRDRWLIADTFACRIGKGRIAALQQPSSSPAASRSS